LPAQFAFQLFNIDVFLDAGVRSGGDYGITIHTDNIPQKQAMGNRITFWGEPSAPSHNEDRFSKNPSSECLHGCVSSAPRVPFLTVPTSCPNIEAERNLLEFKAAVNTWEPGAAEGHTSFVIHNSDDEPTSFTGCDHLGFAPHISVSPDTTASDTPAGLTVDVRVPQEGLVTPGALATSNIKNTVVALPLGLDINPGQAAGLQACQEGPTGPLLPSGEPSHPGRDDLPLPGESGEEETIAAQGAFSGPADCPSASKVGTDEIETPLLKHSLSGNVYVMESNPPNVKLLVTAEGEGVNIKLIGDVSLCEKAGETLDEKTCEGAGQLITKFEKTPELPFTDFKLAFSGGAQAALATPVDCGTYEATSDFTPWSTPEVGNAFPSTSLGITSGPGGGACPSNPLPYAPTLTAGATTDQAGGFTNFSLLLQSPDGQQRTERMQFKAPAGLTGELSKVPLCTNAQAEANECPEASKIGHTVVTSGPGPYPLVVPEPGQPPAAIYLTGPYNGSGACTPGEAGCAPFGLSIVVPLHVGPFTLPTQRVRAKIEVDPRTTQLTVTTNPLPQTVAGVPTDLREVDAVIEHPEFMLNPTNCSPQEFSGTAYGTPPPGVAGAGAEAHIASHFQVGACRALAFEPKFTATTQANGSANNAGTGESFTARVTYPNVPQGTDADIAAVKVELPKDLPSRLTTLQKACTQAQFKANPAGCPAASVIGHAVVHTPLLPVPLVGPVYFVSNGGEAFPNLIVVLQGYGVKVELVGDTLIKNGITSSTFKSVPDAPFSSFELVLPEGKFSALGAITKPCNTKLVVPVQFTGQNGATLNQSVRMGVEGCGKTLSVVSSNVNKNTLKLLVYAPGAGKVTASGKGVSSGVKTYAGNEALTFTLNQKKAGKLKTSIKLSFTPVKGKKQSKSLTVEFKK
jgi:hypothetical protein